MNETPEERETELEQIARSAPERLRFRLRSNPTMYAARFPTTAEADLRRVATEQGYLFSARPLYDGWIMVTCRQGADS